MEEWAMISRLPNPARVKLAVLQEQADILGTLINRSLARANDLQQAVATEIGHPDMNGRLLERARLLENLPGQQAKHRVLVDLLANIQRFVSMLPAHESIGVGPVLKARTVLGGKAPRVLVEQMRKEIAKAKIEIARVANAALPLEEQQKAARDYVARLAKSGTPQIKATHELFEVTRQASWEVSNSNPLPLLAWCAPKLFADALCRDLAARAAPPLALTAQEKADRLAKLRRELLLIEYREECVLADAEADGLAVDRRPDADPRAVLWITTNIPAAFAA